MHIFKTEQYLNIDKATAWSFFSSPQNLAKITPPELDFKILGDYKEKEIYNGMLINYKVRPLLGIPVHWRTEISDVIYQTKFTDKQLKGPYSVWEHTHTFTDTKEGLLMTDYIKYKVPLGPIGTLLNRLFIRNKINAIFEYRKQILESLSWKN